MTGARARAENKVMTQGFYNALIRKGLVGETISGTSWVREGKDYAVGTVCN